MGYARAADASQVPLQTLAEALFALEKPFRALAYVGFRGMRAVYRVLHIDYPHSRALKHYPREIGAALICRSFHGDAHFRHCFNIRSSVVSRRAAPRKLLTRMPRYVFVPRVLRRYLAAEGVVLAVL